MRIKVLCSSCNTLLLRYDKRGNGALVKLDPRRVISDYCTTEAPQYCPADNCSSQFAREVDIKGRPFRKLLGGKVRVVGGGISAR
jgi:hypothetical protein